jgi:hypothetical protein
MSRANDTSRHLLLGLLALQTGLIDQAALVAAFHAWTQDKARPLADHLVALGHLGAAHRPLLEGLAAAHLAQHGGGAEKSLAALPAGDSGISTTPTSPPASPSSRRLTTTTARRTARLS